MRTTQLFIGLLCFLSIKIYSQTTCNVTGDLMLFTNYDGGTLTINVDQNIPNLKIGVVSYEGTQIVLTGAFVNNVAAIRYAGFNSNNNHCGAPISTNFVGQAVTTVTSVVITPASPLANPNGNSSIICGYSCSNSSNQGGCNTVDQVEAYFLNYFTGSTLFAHKVQYGCWSGTQAISAAGNCCPLPPVYPGVIAGSHTVCAGDAAAAFTSVASATVGSGTILYQWQSSASPASGFINIPSATLAAYAPSVPMSTRYYRRAASTTTANVVYSNTLTVGVRPLPVLTVSGQNTVCAGSAATLTANAAGILSYSWMPGNVTFSSITVSPATTQDYTATGTDQFGCNDTALVTVFVNDLPVLDIVASNTIACAGSTVSLMASGAGNYTWMPGGQTGNLLTYTALATTDYTLQGDDGVCSNTLTQLVTVIPVLTVSAVASKTIICRFDRIVLTASGGASYTWTNSTGAAGTVTGASYTATPSSNTTYTVTGSDANSCDGTGIVQVSVVACVGIENAGTIGGSGPQIFPNPNNGDFTLKAGKSMDLEIINSAGQLVRRISLNETNNYNASVLRLAKGIYFVVSKNKDAGVKQKIVVDE